MVSPSRPQTPAPNPKEPVLSLSGIIAVILTCALVLLVGIWLLILWLLRQRAARRRAVLNGEAIISLDGSRSSEEARGARRKLQKVGSVATWPAPRLQHHDDDAALLRHKSLPVIRKVFTGEFGRSQSCKWPSPAAASEIKVCRRTPSWIDEDALHGPEVRRYRAVPERKIMTRGSWPLRDRAPTLPRLHHTIHGYPVAKQRISEASMSGGIQAEPNYAQLRVFARALPEPPKPALIADKDRRIARPSVSMGHVRAGDSSRISQLAPVHVGGPVQSLPRTPSRPRTRHQSADPTLTEILRSTEERLREGSVSGTIRSNRLTASPTKMLGPREFGTTASLIRTPSPKKTAHRRQNSEHYVSSETDSLWGEECVVPHGPSGLTSPDRNHRKQEVGKQPLQVQSVRNSVSSELSTLYSEDEMPEEVKRAIMPLADFVVQPQQAVNVRAPTMNDPFVSMSLPPSVSRTSVIQGCPTKQHKTQNLFRESLERSGNLHRMTAVPPTAQPYQGLILAPRPLAYFAKPGSLHVSPGSSRRGSVTIPSAIQPYIDYHALSSASEPPPSPTRQSPSSRSPKGPLFLRLTKTSTLSTIPSLPPPPAPDYFAALREQRRRTMSPAEMAHESGDNVHRSTTLLLPSTERPSPSNRRVSIVLPLAQQSPPQEEQQKGQNRHSTSSSIYSEDVNPSAGPCTPLTATTAKTQTAVAATDLNHASYHANSQLGSPYPAPLNLPRGNSGSNSPSKLSPVSLATTTATADGNSDSNSDNANANENANENEDENDGQGNASDDGNNVPLSASAAGIAETATISLPSTIASLRRMNSVISTVSSLHSMSDRNPTPVPSATSTITAATTITTTGGGGSGVGSAAGLERSEAAGVRNESPGIGPAGMRGTGGDNDGGGIVTSPRAERRSITVGTRNYFILDGGAGAGTVGSGRQQRRCSKRVSWVSGGENGGGCGGESASKRRRPGGMVHPHQHPYRHHRRTTSTVLRMPSPAVFGFEAGDEGKGKENNRNALDMFKMAGGEFTFEVDGRNRNGLGLREGSGGNVQAQQQPQQRMVTAWKTVDWSGSGKARFQERCGDSPSRGSLKSVDSLGLYDRQGFLIASTPVKEASPRSRV
ncbi:hypothetical protein MMYC01_205119 [Madurella mycetomatis]|uniref:Uncharacterized protein n=1 Tax=Madurella mycetomatis TaxID=100816 RepID=A0A175W6K9_9PEZI|nr:hypothetical protein MMYC01_205119 [Madurella mycetomatis]